MLPTDLFIIELQENRDSVFISQRNITALSDINPSDDSISPTWILTKVVHISRFKSATTSREIKLEDQHQKIIPFILYGDQVNLTHLIKKVKQEKIRKNFKIF